MKLKSLINMKAMLEDLKKRGSLTKDQNELLEELMYLDRKGMLEVSKELYESVSLSSSSCSACGRPY